MKWFRLWNDIMDDPKMLSLDNRQFRIMIYLFCYCSEQENQGKFLKQSVQDIAWRLRTPETEIIDCLEKLEKADIINQNKHYIQFKNWDKRQPNSDNRANRRDYMREYRKKQTESPENPELNPKKQTTKPINIPFEKFWDKYNYKVGRRDKVKTKWIGLSAVNRGLIMAHLDNYVKSTHKNGKFPCRKHPQTYLNNESWLDEETVKGGSVEVESYKLDALGMYYIGYCECGQSDFYDKPDIKTGDTSCCGSAILPVKPSPSRSPKPIPTYQNPTLEAVGSEKKRGGFTRPPPYLKKTQKKEINK